MRRLPQRNIRACPGVCRLSVVMWCFMKTDCLICIPQSQTIAYAEKLGARIEKALTKDVTHLICDKPGSEKYNVIDHFVTLVFGQKADYFCLLAW